MTYIDLQDMYISPGHLQRSRTGTEIQDIYRDPGHIQRSRTYIEIQDIYRDPGHICLAHMTGCYIM